jgi:hypothetical protein
MRILGSIDIEETIGSLDNRWIGKAVADDGILIGVTTACLDRAR